MFKTAVCSLDDFFCFISLPEQGSRRAIVLPLASASAFGVGVGVGVGVVVGVGVHKC